MKDRFFGSVSTTNSGLGSISVPLKYLPDSVLFILFKAFLFVVAQEIGIAGTAGVLGSGGMKLAGSKDSFDT